MSSNYESLLMMKIRRLQRQDDGTWYDDAYAMEEPPGRVIFRYNLTWERLGSHYNQQIRQQQTSLETIERLIHNGPNVRWLAIETISSADVSTYLAKLDQACGIPQARLEWRFVHLNGVPTA